MAAGVMSGCAVGVFPAATTFQALCFLCLLGKDLAPGSPDTGDEMLETALKV